MKMPGTEKLGLAIALASLPVMLVCNYFVWETENIPAAITALVFQFSLLLIGVFLLFGNYRR